MKNNILQIGFNSRNSDFLVSIECYVRKYGIEKDIAHLGSLSLDKLTGKWVANIPQSDASKFIQDASILALEYLLNLPVGFILGSEQGDFATALATEYDARINVNNKDIADNNLHILVHLPVLDPLNVEGLQFIFKTIPQTLRDHIRIHLLIYSSKTYMNLGYEEMSSDAIIDNVQGILKLRENLQSNLKGRLLYLSNHNENGICLNLSDETNLSEYVGRLLIYLMNDYQSLSASRSAADELTSIGMVWRDLDKTKLINSQFRDLLGQVISSFIGNSKKDNNIIDEVFEDFINSNQQILQKEYESDSISESTILDGLVGYIRRIIDSKDYSLSEKDAIIKKLKRIWDINIDDIEDSDNSLTFEDIYMPIFSRIGLETPYPEVKELINEIQQHHKKIKLQQKNLEKLNSTLPPLVRNCIWTDQGFKIGDEVYKLINDVPTDPDTLSELRTYESSVKELELRGDIRSRFSDIRNQGNQGSCVSFSLVSIVEYYLNSVTQKNDLSEAFLYYNAREISNDTESDNGVSIEHAIQALKSNGVCLEELCPYSESIFNRKPSDIAYEDGRQRCIETAERINNDITAIKSAISEGLPVIGSFRIFQSLEDNSDGFVLLPTEEELGEEAKYHAMVICGYNDVNKYFIVRNSWGKKFGNKGYCYIPYSYVRNNELTRNLFIIKMDSTLQLANNSTTEEIDSPANFSPRFNYVINRNKIIDEIFNLNNEKKALETSIKRLRNLVSQILSDTDGTTITCDLDKEIAEIKNKLSVAEDNNIAKRAKRNKLTSIINGTACCGIIGLIYPIISGVQSNNMTKICGFSILSILLIISVFFINLYKKSAEKKNNNISENLRQQIAELETLKAIRIQGFERLQQLLLIISSIDGKVKSYDNNLIQIESSFHNWLSELLKLDPTISNSNVVSDEIKKLTEELTSYIFDNKANNEDIRPQFLNFQKMLLDRLNKNFSGSVYDNLYDKKGWKNFIEELANLEMPVEVHSQVRKEKITFLGDLHKIISDTEDDSHIIELDHLPHSVVLYSNDLLIFGIKEKSFSLNEIKKISL